MKSSSSLPTVSDKEIQADETGENVTTTRFIETIEQASGLPDQLFADYLLKQDNLYRRIPADKKPELLRKAMECGKQAAAAVKNQPLSESLQQAGIQLTFTEETSDKPKETYTLAEIRLPDRITLNRTLIDAGQQLIEQQPQLQFLTERAAIADILTAHEWYHYLENRDQLFTTEKHIQYKIGPFSKTARIHALSEIAATAFAKEFFGLAFSPLLFNPVLLYPVNEAFSEDFLDQLQQQARDSSLEAMD